MKLHMNLLRHRIRPFGLIVLALTVFRFETHTNQAAAVVNLNDSLHPASGRLPVTQTICDAPLGHLITFQRGLTPAAKRAIIHSAGFEEEPGSVRCLVPENGKCRSYGTGFKAKLDPASVLHQQLLQHPGILAIEPDQMLEFAQQASGEEIVDILPGEQRIPTGLRRVGLNRANLDLLQSYILAQSSQSLDLDVAVIDSGIDKSHPELNVYRSVSLVGLDPEVDWDGHGTHVAGILGAYDNHDGVVGMVPGVRLWSVQVAKPGSFTVGDALQGMAFVAAHASEIDVVNASFVTIGRQPLEAYRASVQEIVEKGVVFVAGVGNRAGLLEGSDLTFSTDDDILPAALKEVMAVSAMVDDDGMPGNDDHWAWSSASINVHRDATVVSPGGAIDVTAPGVNILSTLPGGKFGTKSGTSMATAHAAGMAALFIATHRREIERLQGIDKVYFIRQRLIDSAQPVEEWESSDIFEGDGFPEPLVMLDSAWFEVPRSSTISARPSTAGEGVEITFSSILGKRYSILSSQSLGSSQWQLLRVVSGAEGSTKVVVPEPESAGFFRIDLTAAP